MTNKGLLTTGIVGSVVAVLCCFTPLLVVSLGAIGLSAWLAWADFVLFPALAVFIALTVFAFSRQRQATAEAAAGGPENEG